MDQVEDLTLFLDEEFDTEDVDLFEFTGAGDSPLTQLKAIVLSLDWEINAATLEQLSKEISNLQQSELFSNDKISQIYLQALDKVGRYIQRERVHAHPNAIKLLLTLYYNFEKIVSSSEITEPEITALIQGDVRKFKILQYQIAQAQGKKTPEAIKEGRPGIPAEGYKALLKVHAAVLSLDWEVTDKGLSDLSEQLNALQNQFSENRYVLILVQGLRALNSYISDERAHAHPETFSLLHFFYEGLRLLIEDNETDEKKCRAIIIERINSLNNLKAIIANIAEAAPPSQEEILDIATDEKGENGQLTDEELYAVKPSPGAVEEDKDIAGLSDFEEAGDEQKGITPALSESIEEITEDEFLPEGELKEAEEIIPALADFEQEGGFDETKALEEAGEKTPEELEEKLNFFFGEEEKTPAPETITEKIPEAAAVQELFEKEKTQELEEMEEITPALAGLPDKKRDYKPDEQISEALEKNLDFFFGADEEPPPTEVIKKEAPPATSMEKLFEDKEAVEKDLSLSGKSSQALVRKIQEEFNKKEKALKEEIQSLRQEIQSLRQEIHSQ